MVGVPVSKRRAVLVAEIVGGVGVLWTLIGAWQQTEQLVEDWPRVVRWIGSPRSGVVVVIVALVVYAWLQLRKQPKPDPVTLVGKFFHTFQPGEDTWQYQGQVLREENGRLFVQLYEPMLGEASTQQFLTHAQADSARFYDSEEEWRDEGNRMNRKAFGD